MTLQTAKNKVIKAEKTLQFAINKGLPHSNYPAVAYNKCFGKLSFVDSEKFAAWYAERR